MQFHKYLYSSCWGVACMLRTQCIVDMASSFLSGQQSHYACEKVNCLPVLWNTVVSHQWCDLFSSTTAQLYATHRKSEERRKRHCTKYTGLRPCWRSLRQVRVSSHAGRSDFIMAPPPPPSTCKQANFQWFWEKAAKKYDSLFLETQKWHGWNRTAFVILYKLEWKW